MVSRYSLLLPVLRRAFPAALAAYAFGSRVTGNVREDSDLDLAVLLPGYANPLQLWDVSAELAEVAGCPVDLLDLRAATTVMQHQVLTQGVTLFATQPATGLFECFVMGEKIALDEARAGLLADIAKEGRVYGG
jgi:predicted nucleotidyltransferase